MSGAWVVRVAGAVAVAAVVAVVLTVGAGGAVAAGAARWSVSAVATPTSFTPGDASGDERYVVTVTNTGDAATSGPVAIEDVLPAGVTVHPGPVQGQDDRKGEPAGPIAAFELYGAEPAPVQCEGVSVVRCVFAGPMIPGDQVRVAIATDVAGSVAGRGTVAGRVSASGGGASPVAVATSTSVTGVPAGFGVARESLVSVLSSAQAGAHPNFTLQFAFQTSTVNNPSGHVRDVQADFPRGLVGNATVVPQCTMARVEASTCPADSMVGIATVTVAHGVSKFAIPKVAPVYNIRPYGGEPAAMAFQVLFPVRLDVGVRSDGEYELHISSDNLTEGSQIEASSVTVWGVPADYDGPGADLSSQITIDPATAKSFGGPGGGARAAFLTDPTACSGEVLSGGLAVDAWEVSGQRTATGYPNLADPAWDTLPFAIGRIDGCEKLSFGASLAAAPASRQAGEPAGYSFDLQVPQSENPDGLATPTVKRVVTTLPLGTVISPSAADGLLACSDAQFAIHSGLPGVCPLASQVGRVSISTPALPRPLTGQVLLGEPLCDPCTPADAAGGRMVRLFLQVVGEGESGIVVKLEGRGYVNQQTGQVTTVFDQTPQLPFDELKLELDGGERATLSNPRVCGPATSSMDLTPWSTPFTPDATPSSTFEVNEDCFGAQFSPSFAAGTTSNQAGGFSPLTVSFGRADQEQFLSGIQLRLPPGLLASVVEKCEEPHAALGDCPAGSLIGHATVLTGPGADPFAVQGGRVFFTGPYRGAPFGLSVVVPAKAGPYTLSGTTGTGFVVVRAAVNIDPRTAQLSVTSDPFPTMLDGIPLQLRRVDISTDRPGFVFNPTSCGPLQIAGTLASVDGASANVSSHFQVTNCASLAFTPSFTASTSGHTSRARGASLDVKLSFPSGSFGSEANVAKVKVSLPRQLPSQLKTLKEACPARVFNANPGACPTGSIVGVAKASTPVLPVQLTGPVYFVSHGGEAFPDLVIVLQGDGVRVDLTGSTFISKAGITSSTFRTVPDVPVQRFELYLPQGAHPALAANTNLCRVKGGLHMPTTFTAQDGAVIKQSTPIAVTGCGAVKASRARRAANGHDRSGGGR